MKISVGQVRKIIKEEISSIFEDELEEMARSANTGATFTLTDKGEKAASASEGDTMASKILKYMLEKGEGVSQIECANKFAHGMQPKVNNYFRRFEEAGLINRESYTPQYKPRATSGEPAPLGRRMTDVGVIGSAFKKYTSGSYDYNEQEKTLIKSIYDSSI